MRARTTTTSTTTQAPPTTQAQLTTQPPPSTQTTPTKVWLPPIIVDNKIVFPTVEGSGVEKVHVVGMLDKDIVGPESKSVKGLYS